jgi:hypothetical protein
LSDRVAYRTTAPWPTAANSGGVSLQLVDPRRDNRLVANWAARMGTSTNAPRNMVPLEGSWRYWQAAADPSPGWTGRVYDDSAWPSGKALLYVETAALPATKNTPLTLGQMSYLFRTRFQFDGNPEGAAVRLSTIIDDGAVFYLNGQPFYWLGMADRVVPARNATANRTVGDAVTEGPFTVAVTNLAVGENVLAVEVHQNSSTSSDIVLGAALDVIDVRREGATPGYVNSVRADLDPFPGVALNEVEVFNASGPADAAGDRDPWIELVNFGPETASLAGCYLGDSFASPGRWAFPAGAAIEAGGFRLVWADGELAESSATEWHAGFRLAGPTGVVVLARMQAGQWAVVDYLEYADLGVDRSFGYLSPRTPSAGPAVLPVATPGMANLPPAPVFTGIEPTPGGAWAVSWTAVAGLAYRLEATNDLNVATWEGVGQLQAAGPVATLVDSNTTAASRFYRVRVVP